MFGKVRVRKWKIIVPLVAVVVIAIAGLGVATGGAVFARIPSLVNDAIGIFIPSNGEFDYKKELPISGIVSKEGKTIVTTKNGELVLFANKGKLEAVDENGQVVSYKLDGNTATTEDERFRNIKLEFIYAEGQDVAQAIYLIINNSRCFVLMINDDNGVYLVDGYTNMPMELKDAPYWGFEGKEKLGSARGYIWSRTFPMLKGSMFIGQGPDTYALEFPQYDYMAKWWAYDTPNMIVDKPHNLYLQIWFGQGGIALLAFLGLVIVYLIDCIKLYAFKDRYDNHSVVGMSTMLGVVGYLGAGLFNDSVVSVAPIFWIVLGAGIAVNYIINKEETEYQKRVAHATIDMKSRKKK